MRLFLAFACAAVAGCATAPTAETVERRASTMTDGRLCFARAYTKDRMEERIYEYEQAKRRLQCTQNQIDYGREQYLAEQRQRANTAAQWDEVGRLGAGLLAAPRSAPPVGGGYNTNSPAFFKGDQVSGFNRICFYDRLGNVVAITILSTQICPLNLP